MGQEALRSLETDSEEAREGALDAMLSIGRNILEHINDPGKFAHIRKTKPLFHSKLGKYRGHENCMRALGFDDVEDAQLWSWSSSLAQRTQDSMQILRQAQTR